MRNGEKNPYQDLRKYGRRTTNVNTNEEARDQQCHCLFRKKGRGKRGVTIAVTSFCGSILLLNGISLVSPALKDNAAADHNIYDAEQHSPSKTERIRY